MISGGKILKNFYYYVIKFIKEIGKISWAFLGMGIFICFILLVSEKAHSLMGFLPKNIVTIVLALCIFCFVLRKFFKDKIPGYGPYNTSTLLITLALMVAFISFLVDGVDGDDIAKIVFAVIGFAGGLFAGKDPDKDKKGTEEQQEAQ